MRERKQVNSKVQQKKKYEKIKLEYSAILGPFKRNSAGCSSRVPECLVIGELSQRSSWIRLLSGLESQSSSGGTKRTDAQSVQKKIHLMHLLRIHTVYIYKNWHQSLVVWCVFIKTEHFQTAVFNLIAVSIIIPLLEGYVKVKEPF